MLIVFLSLRRVVERSGVIMEMKQLPPDLTQVADNYKASSRVALGMRVNERRIG